MFYLSFYRRWYLFNQKQRKRNEAVFVIIMCYNYNIIIFFYTINSMIAIMRQFLKIGHFHFPQTSFLIASVALISSHHLISLVIDFWIT